MKKWLSVCTLLFVGVLAIIVIQNFSAKTHFDSVHSASLSIGVERNYEPFSYVDANGELTGFDVQIADALCRRMNRFCTVQPMVFHDLLPALRNGQLDLVIAGVGQTPERSKEFAFSQTYYRSKSFFITSDPAFVGTPDEKIPQMIIGVQRGSLQELFVQNHYVARGAQMLHYETYEAMLQAINKGDINLIFSDGLPGYAILKSASGLQLLIAGRPPLQMNAPEDNSLTEAKIVARKKDTLLIEKINASLLQMQTEGEYQELHARFFPFVTF